CSEVQIRRETEGGSGKREEQRKENVQGKKTELQKVEVWLTAIESPRTAVSSEENYLAEKTQLAGKMSAPGGKEKCRQEEKLVSHSGGQAHLRAGSHSNGKCLWHQAVDEEHTLDGCCVACQPLPQTEILFGMYHWSKDHMKATVSLSYIVSHTQ
ncbi:unnamed protein product, partial [Bubo scandiacus]